MWLQGTWFWQIAYTLFNPSLGEKPTMDVNDPESVMVTTLYFSFHIIAACSCKLSPPVVTFNTAHSVHTPSLSAALYAAFTVCDLHDLVSLYG